MRKRVVIDKPGSYGRLRVQQESIPSVQKDEVLISVRACGVNFADCCVRMGVYRPVDVYAGFPMTPGFEVAGIVEHVGEGVKDFKEGQKVIGLTRFGGYTTHIALPKEQVFALPESFSFKEGAAIPVNFLTAYYGLIELGDAKKASQVLVHSAAGGVGSAILQLARWKQCRITAVVGASHKVESTKELGADHVIDLSSQSLWKEAEKIAPDGYDIVMDANGPKTLKQSYRHLATGGRLVVYGFHTMLTKGRGKPNWLKVVWQYLKTPCFNPLNMTTDNHSVMAFNLCYMFDKITLLGRAMHHVISLLEKGNIRLPDIRTFPLSEVGQAHRALESGQTVGKLVLIP